MNNLSIKGFATSKQTHRLKKVKDILGFFFINVKLQ